MMVTSGSLFRSNLGRRPSSREAVLWGRLLSCKTGCEDAPKSAKLRALLAVYDPSMGLGSASLAAFIVAGGKSTRMGADKAFVVFDGLTLLDRMLDLARSATTDVHIVGDPAKFRDFAPVVEDVYRECGPLGGIHAAL